MRPQTAHRVVYNSINKLLYKGQMYNKPLMLRALSKLLDKAFISNKDLATRWGCELVASRKDIQLGDGGYELYKNPLGQLHYISDRFNCDFRLYWLERLVEEDLFDGSVKRSDLD